MRTATAFLLLFLTCCSAPYELPKSICDLSTLASWSGADVRWHGVVVGGYHGYSLVAEDCQRRGIALDGFGGSTLDKAINDRGLKTGLLRADVSGKIIERDGDYRLLVTKVHSVAFEPMGDEAYYQYWRSKGF